MKHCGYIPPESFEFQSEREALGHLAAALCAVECARFYEYLEGRFKASDKGLQPLAQFAPAYILIEWTQGEVGLRAYKGRNRRAYQDLVSWSNAVVEINTFFRDHDVQDPVNKLIELDLIRKNGNYGYEPNLYALGRFLDIELDERDLGDFFERTA